MLNKRCFTLSLHQFVFQTAFYTPTPMQKPVVPGVEGGDSVHCSCKEAAPSWGVLLIETHMLEKHMALLASTWLDSCQVLVKRCGGVEIPGECSISANNFKVVSLMTYGCVEQYTVTCTWHKQI